MLSSSHRLRLVPNGWCRIYVVCQKQSPNWQCHFLLLFSIDVSIYGEDENGRVLMPSTRRTIHAVTRHYPTLVIMLLLYLREARTHTHKFNRVQRSSKFRTDRRKERKREWRKQNSAKKRKVKASFMCGGTLFIFIDDDNISLACILYYYYYCY